MMKIKAHIILLVISVLILPSFLHAQHWKNIASVSGIPTAGFFWDKHNGIIAVGNNGTNYSSQITIYKVTFNKLFGSYSLTQCDPTGALNGFQGFISSIYFRDQNTGWLTLFAQNFPSYYKSGVWVTNDGGINWQPLIDSSQWDCIYETPAHRLIVSDGGIAFADSLVGMLCTAASPPSTKRTTTSLTTDGGITWKPLNTFPVFSEAWGIYCQKSSRNFFVCPEGAPGWATANPYVFVTTDYGDSWQTAGKVPMEFVSSPANPWWLYGTGDIEGYANAIYVQSEAKGMFRSTDEGKNWDSVGGPSTNYDIRFNVIPVCKGGTVIAFDRDGNVWMTNDGGDGKIQQDPLFTVKSPSNFKSITSCDSIITSLNFIYAGCGFVEYDSVYLENPHTLFSIFHTPVLPLIRNEGIRDSVYIQFTPQRKVGTFNTKIHLIGKIITDDSTRNFDTVFSITGEATAVPPDLYYTGSFDFGNLSTCLPPEDTTITLTNKGCDTLQITSGPGAMAGEFSLLTVLTLPLKLAPDSSVTIKFRFKPSGTGFFRTQARFTALQQTLTQNIIIDLQGSGEKEVGVLSYEPKQFNFKSLSICAHDSASGFITNIGCDSMKLDPAQLFGNPDYKVSGVGGQVLELKPKDTIRYEVYLNPAQKGIRQGYLVLNSNDGVNSRLDTIPFTVTVTDGTRILSASTNTLDFGATTLCEQRDSVIHLSNTGCDTLEISGIGFRGSGFGTNFSFPIILFPGKDTTIDIFTLLDTIGGKTSNSATLTFTSNSDNTISPISLTRSYIPSKNINVGYYLDPTIRSGGDQSIVNFDIKESAGKTFTGAGIKQITFDLLNYNTDLLQYTQTKSSANLSSLDGKSFTITGSPEITADANGILASVGFRVYLTKDSITTINMTNRIDTTILPCSIMTLTSGGTAIFNYQFLCGERGIAQFMNGILIKITGIRPNPAQDEIEINLQSAVKQNATIEIFDALGAKKFSDTKNMISGSNTYRIDTKGLSSGMYLVRVGDVSQSLVISR